MRYALVAIIALSGCAHKMAQKAETTRNAFHECVSHNLTGTGSPEEIADSAMGKCDDDWKEYVRRISKWAKRAGQSIDLQISKARDEERADAIRQVNEKRK